MNNDEAVVRSKNIGLNHGAKSLLRNVIRHTDTHNRHKEESEMWNLYSKIKSNENSDDDSRRGKDRLNRGNERKYFKDQDVQNSFLYDDREEMECRRRGVKRAHMDDASEGRADRSKSGGESTYWMRQLHNFEAADPDRWGHSGFKELYPEVYNSDRSSPGATGMSKSHSKKKRKKKNKKERDEPLSKKKKKKKRRSESDQERAVDVKHKVKRKYSRTECQETNDKHSSRRRKKDDSSDSDHKSREKTRTKSSKRKKRKRYSKIENEKDRLNESDRDS